MLGMLSAFSVLRPQRQIRFDSMPLKLGADEFEILALLIERGGQALSERELLDALASSTIREPDALWTAVSHINLTLAEHGAQAGYVEHTPAAGYAMAVPTPVKGDGSGWPAASIFGRDDSREWVSAQLLLRRFVNIVGPGGIGKTTLAQAVVQGQKDRYPDGVHFVDLAPISAGRFVPAAVAAVLGIPVPAADTGLAAYLRTRRALIVLDSCEHLLTAVSVLAETILPVAAQIHVLATSREPLRAAGEWVHRLGPLGLPARNEGLTAAEAGSYPGIRLFVERVRAVQPRFVLTDELAGAVGGLCRRLDGIPLAIELAAARVARLGIQDVLAQVEDRLLEAEEEDSLRSPPRHRTLQAMFDWSHELLSAQEQLAFRRLAVLRGNFSLAVAVDIIDDGDTTGSTESILDLVAKSLVAVVPTRGLPLFRLLDPTRAYAAAKLSASRDRLLLPRRHALAMRELLTEAEVAWEQMNSSDWRARYALWVNDVRAALDWAFRTAGEDELALQLTNLAFPLADQTALIAEYGDWADLALERLPRLQGKHPLLEIRLRMLPVFFRQREPADPGQAIDAMRKVLQLAQDTGTAKCQAGPLMALWGICFQNGEYAAAFNWSRQLGELGQQKMDPVLVLLSRRTGAQVSHYLGDHGLAHRWSAEVLDRADTQIPWAYFPSPVDSRVSMQIVRVRALWLQGQPGRAMALLHEYLQLAGVDTPLGLCQALALGAIPLALWSGDAALARGWIQELRELEDTYAFRYWRSWWQAFDSVLALREGDAHKWADFDAATQGCAVKLKDQLATFGLGWLDKDTADRVDAGAVGWCAPEVLRVRGEAMRQQAGAGADAAAEELFQRALRTAKQQGALAWELRAAASLAGLWQSQERTVDALSLLSGVRERFTDGFRIADLDSVDARLMAWKELR